MGELRERLIGVVCEALGRHARDLTERGADALPVTTENVERLARIASEAADKIAALLAAEPVRLAALEDTARLDWLDNHPKSVEYDDDGSGGMWTAWDSEEHEDWSEHVFLRAAIDAARSAEGGDTLDRDRGERP
jgi:hypothetical protein